MLVIQRTRSSSSCVAEGRRALAWRRIRKRRQRRIVSLIPLRANGQGGIRRAVCAKTLLSEINKVVSTDALRDVCHDNRRKA